MSILDFPDINTLALALCRCAEHGRAPGGARTSGGARVGGAASRGNGGLEDRDSGRLSRLSALRREELGVGVAMSAWMAWDAKWASGKGDAPRRTSSSCR